MRRVLAPIALLLAIQWMQSGSFVRGEELTQESVVKNVGKVERGLADSEPVMIDITNRAPPSQEEWNAMHAQRREPTCSGVWPTLAARRSPS